MNSLKINSFNGKPKASAFRIRRRFLDFLMRSPSIKEAEGACVSDSPTPSACR
jgi:hypothetical protein